MKMLKVMALLSLLMLVVSCGGSTGATGAAKKYIIATDATYAPFEFQENGKYIGIDVDLITEIAKVEGFEFELKPMDFGGIIPALQSGQIDGAIAGASITEERKEIFNYLETKHIFSAQEVLEQFPTLGRASIFRTIRLFLEI